MKHPRLTFITIALLLSVTAIAQNTLPDWALGGFVRPSALNPVLSPDSTTYFYCPMQQKNVAWESNDTFNPAAAVKGNRIVVLYRAEDKSGVGIGKRTSRIGYAESEDGLHFKRDKEPVLYPGNDSQRAYEYPGGCEDPRVAVTEDGTYVMFYTQWNRDVARIGVATSRDLRRWQKHGPVFAKAYNGKFLNTWSKSGAIVTKIKNGKQVIAKVNGRYFMYFGEHGVYGAVSDDLKNWTPVVNNTGGLKPFISPRKGYFDSDLTECGPPAVITDQGILLLYNGKNKPGAGGDRRFNGNAYCAGQVLFDAQDPTKVKARLDVPFLRPMEPFEKSGQYVDGTVFIEGLVYFKNKWFLYYGCADSRVAVAVYDPAVKTPGDAVPARKTEEVFNYDEAKVAQYQLPDVLQSAGGKRVASRQDWEGGRRPEILRLLGENVYGAFPGAPAGMHFMTRSVDSAALGGKAIAKQVRIFFAPGNSAPFMDVLLYLPRNAAKPVRVFTGLNFMGNHTTNADPSIALAASWVPNRQGVKNNQASDSTRGFQAGRWEAEKLVERGYALATAYYGDLEPDHAEGWRTGIRTTLQESLKTRPAEWGAIGAWGWGLSRMVDYLQTEPGIDPKGIIITGHSRLGKAALWAAANDTRFAMVVSNNSGEGGAALSRRWFGETIERINTAFPHWFVAKYKTYNGRPEAMPTDQHMLLALAAPRPLYVASASEDLWADPKGEFLSARYTEPVYALYGLRGLGTLEMPPVDTPAGNIVHYHIRTGKHDITWYDWDQYIRLADQYLK
jgi:predicted GH43/DUF377 family glycosyl hydrolase